MTKKTKKTDAQLPSEELTKHTGTTQVTNEVGTVIDEKDDLSNSSVDSSVVVNQDRQRRETDTNTEKSTDFSQNDKNIQENVANTNQDSSPTNSSSNLGTSEQAKDAAISNVVTLQDRWEKVNDGWVEFKSDITNEDSYVHFLISLDSFINHANEHRFDTIVIEARVAMALAEELQDQDTPALAEVTVLMNRVGDLVRVAPTLAGLRAKTVAGSQGTGVEEVRTQWVVMYWPNAEEASDVCAQMEHYGYSTSIQTTLSKAVQTAIAKNAAMLVVDVSHEPASLIREPLQLIADAEIPWLAISTAGDFNERLELVRLKVSSVLIKPVTASILVDAIDRSSRTTIEEPFRVLVVDDSPVVHEFVKQTLGAQGIETMILDDISQILVAMNEFSPDLLLLDIRMPTCSGLEVAQIIRQHESYVSVPIVYLSTETNRQIQLEAIRLGGDEFLTKPIQPEHLLATVTSKIERYRMLRRFMIQDSLTGLLNHTRIKQHLSQSILIANRDNQPVSYAMLDIDHFKKVNDTYGHPVGDRVIKSLAKLLRQRVRKSDVVGRYGGEEFAVVLHGAKPEDAFRTMDRIRKDFSTVYHPYENGIFAATFSCGIASFPAFDDPTVIAAKADMALYEAKRNGRNKVVIYNPATKVPKT